MTDYTTAKNTVNHDFSLFTTYNPRGPTISARDYKLCYGGILLTTYP